MKIIQINYSFPLLVTTLITFPFIFNYIPLASCKNNFTVYTDQNWSTSRGSGGLNGGRHRQAEHQDRNITNLLDALLLGYDNHLRPNFRGPPVEVFIDLEVRSMGPISEIDMSYSMDCYFRQEWKDSRLAYDPSAYRGSPTTLALSISMLDKIWKPDTYFYNGKAAYIHTITNPNKFVRIGSDGMVRYSSRLTVKASCPMHLESFPMDTQRCPLELGSFGYNAMEVVYRWNVNRTVVIASDMKMSQFDLRSHPSGNITNHNRKGIMTILTMTFLGLETRNDLPKVSYMTALDYFAAIAFAFIFATILQFALVHYFTKVGSGEYYFPPPECINNVSGKIEWNLTSAQIRVKKEEQKKIRMEEEEKKEEEKKRKDNEDGSKSCQSLDQKSGDEVVGRLKGDPSPDDQQEHVKLRKVQLPLLEVAESSLENYSFHHPSSSGMDGHQQQHQIQGQSVDDADVTSGDEMERSGNRMVQVVVPRLRDELGSGSNTHSRFERVAGGEHQQQNGHHQHAYPSLSTFLDPSLLPRHPSDKMMMSSSSGDFFSTCDEERSRRMNQHLEQQQQEVVSRTVLPSISTTCDQHFSHSNFIPPSSSHSLNRISRNSEAKECLPSTHKHTSYRRMEDGMSMEESEEVERIKRQQQKQEEEELMVRILMLGNAPGDDPFLDHHHGSEFQQQFDICPVHGKIIPLGPARRPETVSTIPVPDPTVVPSKYPRSVSVIGMDPTYMDDTWIVQQESVDPRPRLVHRKTTGSTTEWKKLPAEQESKESVHEPPKRDEIQESSSIGTSPFNRFTSFRDSVNRGLKTLSDVGGKRSVNIATTSGHTISFQLNSISHIDRVSRIIFPFAFLITNFLYWTTYLADDN